MRIVFATVSLVLIILSGCDSAEPDSSGSSETPKPPSAKTAPTNTGRGAENSKSADTAKAPTATEQTPAIDSPPLAGGDKPNRAIKHQQYVVELTTIIDENTQLLKSVVDVPTAEKVLPQLQVQMEKMARVGEKTKALGQIPKEQNALLTTPLGDKLLDATESFTKQMKRLQSNPEAFEIIRKGLEKQKTQ